MAGDPPRARSPLVWPLVQLGLLVLPLAAAGALRAEMRGPSDAVFASALLLQLLIPWSGVLAVLLGAVPDAFLPRADRGDAARRVEATSWRMLAVLLVAPAALARVEAPDLVAPSAEWLGLGTWLGAGAVPFWAAALLVRVRGRGALLAAAVAAGTVLLLVGGATSLGFGLDLDPSARRPPVLAAGIVAGLTLYLAATERVAASLPKVLGAAGLLASGTAALLGWRLGSAPLSVAWVTQLLDERADAVLLEVSVPNRHPHIVQVDLRTGRARDLSRLANRALYVGSELVTLREDLSDVLLGRRPMRRLCLAGMPPVCVDADIPSGSGTLAPRPRLARIVAGTPNSLVAWDLETNQVWEARRDGRVRWPCFTDDGHVLYRVQREDGPYDHELLRLTDESSGPPRRPGPGDVESLALDHDHRCVEASAGPVEATFVRGFSAVGREATLAGPGLPPEGVPLGDDITTFAWSDDGRTGALASGVPRTLRFYREDLGLTAPQSVRGLSGVTVSPEGRWVAHGLEDVPHAVVVRSVPDGTERLRVTNEVPRLAWDSLGRLLHVVEGRLLALDPGTGLETELFPADTPRR